MPHINHPAFKDQTGVVVGVLTVLGYAGTQNRHKMWFCECRCGTIIKVASCNISTGHTKSCGCYSKERLRELHTTHGMTNTKVYGIWSAMKYRCENPNSSAFADYGGRGITVCEQWSESFEAFLDDMGMPSHGMTIDRIDNESGYRPDNCRWATRKQQAANSRRTRWVTVNGKKVHAPDAAVMGGVRYKTLMARLYSGWSDHDAVFGRTK